MAECTAATTHRQKRIIRAEMGKNFNWTSFELSDFGFGIVALFAGTAVFLLSVSYSTGPAYLQDEIGYLAKAAFLAGRSVDGSSSYHGGIAFLIMPSFLLFDDPAWIWRAILFINSLVCAGIIFLLSKMVRDYAASTDARTRFGAFVLCLVYPSMWVMAGYIFTNVYLIFFFLLAIHLNRQGQSYGMAGNVGQSLAIGFTYWIHPTGLAICAASAVSRVLFHIRCPKEISRANLAIHIAVIVLMVLSYKGIHSYMNWAMTPEGMQPLSHYGAQISRIKILTPDGILEIARTFLGHVSYLVISTLGLGVFGLIYLAMQAGQSLRDRLHGLAGDNGLFILLSTLGLLVMGAISLSNQNNISTIVHGRYQEIAYLPLLLTGYIFQSKASRTTRTNIYWLITFFLLLALVFIGIAYGSIHSINNLVNTIGLYPQYFLSNLGLNMWLVVGLATILALQFLGRWIFIPVLCILSMIAIKNQITWHQNILMGYSNPNPVYSFISDNLNKGACVAFDLYSAKQRSLFDRERFDILKFYLFNYNYKRMVFDSWKADCDGPFLTFTPEKYVRNGGPAEVIAKDIRSGLFVLSKPEYLDEYKKLKYDGLYSYKEGNIECLLAGCFAFKAADLTAYTQIGILNGERIVAREPSQSGYLFYGPYYPLRKGAFQVELEIDVFSRGAYELDVVSDGGKKIHARADLSPKQCAEGDVFVLPFAVAEDASNLEVRMRTISSGDMAVKGYRVIFRPENSENEPRCINQSK